MGIYRPPQQAESSKLPITHGLNEATSNLIAAQAVEIGVWMQDEVKKRRYDAQRDAQKAHEKLIEEVKRQPERSVTDIVASLRCSKRVLEETDKQGANILHFSVMEGDASDGDDGVAGLAEWVANPGEPKTRSLRATVNPAIADP